MLKYIATAAFLLQLVVAQRGLADAAAAYQEFSGRQVQALDLTYQALSSLERSNLSSSQVQLSKEHNGKVDVLLAQPTEKRSFQVSLSKESASSASPTRLTDIAVTLSGLDAKAIAIWYRSLILGNVSGPSVAILRAAAFSIKEAFVADMGPTKLSAAYVVRYLPSGASWNVGPFPDCGSFINYTIPPTTWRVGRQPKIC